MWGEIFWYFPFWKKIFHVSFMVKCYLQVLRLFLKEKRDLQQIFLLIPLKINLLSLFNSKSWKMFIICHSRCVAVYPLAEEWNNLFTLEILGFLQWNHRWKFVAYLYFWGTKHAEMPAATFQAFFLYIIISREPEIYFLEPFWKGIY